jgi:hypothetical protein
MTHRFWNRMLSRLALALGLTLALSWTASPSLAAAAKDKPAVTAKAKKPDKGKAVTPEKGAKKNPGAAAKAGKSGKKSKTAAKDGKAVKDTKTAGKAAKPNGKDAKTGKDAKAVKSGEEIAKTDKPKSKKGLSAKTAPIDPAEAMEEEVDEFESDAKEKDRPSTSPMLYVFILFILGCVAGYLYMKKKQEIKASGANSGEFTSSHGEVFGSNLSSLNADSRRADRSRAEGGDAAGASVGKKIGWRQSKLFTSISEQLKTSSKKPLDASSRNIPSKLSSDSAAELSAGPREAPAKNTPTRATEKAAPKAPAAAAPKPTTGGAAEQPLKLEIPAPQKQTQIILPAPAVDDELMTHVGVPPANSVTNETRPFTDPPLTDADWNGWDKIEAEEFWYRVKKIDQEGIDSGDDAYVAALKQSGFRDRLHYEQVKDAYRARFPAASEPQAMMNASTRAADEKLRTPPAPKPTEDTATKAGTADTMSSGTESGEPCSFERYVEIREAQNSWSQQGKDIAGMLLETFQLTVADWSVIAQYWSERLLANAQLAGEDSVLTERYRQKFGYVQAS